MKKSISVIALLGMLLCQLFPVMASEEPVGTEVSGIISENIVWTEQGSPYRVTGNILVQEGASLSIGPGATVTNASAGQSADYYIQVEGTLDIAGSSADRVAIDHISLTILSSDNTLEFCSFNQSVTIKSQRNTVSHCEFRSSSLMLDLYEYGGGRGFNSIEFCNFEKDISVAIATTGIILKYSSHNTIRNCTFDQSFRGIQVERCDNNYISDVTIENSKTGIFMQYAHNNIVEKCDIFSNEIGLYSRI